MRDFGRHVYGLAAIWLGAVGLCFDDFAAVWQPVPDHLPGRAALAYGCALALLVLGAAMQLRRTARWASLGLAAITSVFALLWAWRVVGHPQVFGTWSGAAEQLAIVVGGVVAWACLQPPGAVRAGRIVQAGRLVFGVCLLAFGAAHFAYPAQTAAMVPKWLPPGQMAWVHVTGACHALAGLALLSGLCALLAARLATAMFVGFGVLAWAPELMAHPHSHMAWAGNGVNLALVGAVWVVADSIARFGPRTLSALDPSPAAR